MKTSTNRADSSVHVVALYQDKTTKRTSIPLIRSQFSRNFNWRLPGGITTTGETIEQTAKRSLNEKTGLAESGLLQLHVFNRASVTDTSKDHHVYLFAANIESLDAFYPFTVCRGKGLQSAIFSLDEIFRYIEKRVKLNGYEMMNSHEKSLRVAFEQIRAL
jgi:ADP-ribose pyrophosphatase YjhB (NUDIX family)